MRPPEILGTAVLYLRVSTGRQAEQDLSIPDQRRQGETYCRAKGWSIVGEYVEPGASATDDRRPEFQRMMDAACSSERPFEAIVVHSFSRFFRDHFELEFNIRRLAKHGVKLVSVTQELGDDPTSIMMRQIMALFDEYQSRENAKHTLRSMKENARQGYWNGSRPPLGYRVVAAEQRGAKVKKRLEIDPIQAETIRTIFNLFLNGDGERSSLGVKAIADHLNRQGVRTRDGGRFAVKTVHQILTRSTYCGRHRFNAVAAKTGRRKPEAEVVEMAVPAIIDPEEFAGVQALLKDRAPNRTPPRVVSGPCLLTGLAYCATCGGGMTLRTGKYGRYRYYTCSTCARQGKTACPGRTIRMDHLDALVIDHLIVRLLQPERLAVILDRLIDDTRALAEQRRLRLAELKQRAQEAEAKLARLYAAIETGIADPSDRTLRDRIIELQQHRDQAQAAVTAVTQTASQVTSGLTPAKLEAFAAAMRAKLAAGENGFRKAYLRVFTERVEVDDHEVRIIGSKTALLRAVTASSGQKPGPVLSFVRRWRPHGDSNPGLRRERAPSWASRRWGHREANAPQ